VRTDTIVKTLPFDSETGMPQYDPVARKVYVNLQDQSVFAIIDPETDTVVGRSPVGRCKGNHGMTLDPERHRVFLSCEGNRRPGNAPRLHGRTGRGRQASRADGRL